MDDIKQIARRERIEGKCAKCGIYRWSLDRDHIIPKSKGGSDDLSNIQLLCQNCHSDKTCEDRKGVRPSADSLTRRSEAMKQRFIDDPTLAARMSAPNVGRKQSIETRAKQSAARTGKIQSTETRARISKAKRTENLSIETRKRMSEAGRNRKIKVIKDCDISSIDRLAHQLARVEKKLAKLKATCSDD